RLSWLFSVYLQKYQSSQYFYFIKAVFIFSSMVTGAGALFWNFYDYRQRQAGFMKLRLRCKCESEPDGTYIVSKTTIQNTSRKYIKIGNTFLVIVKSSVKYHDAMELVSKKTGTPLTKERHIQYKKIFNYLKEKGIETLEDADFYLKPLDYYYRLPLRLGSL